MSRLLSGIGLGISVSQLISQQMLRQCAAFLAEFFWWGNFSTRLHCRGRHLVKTCPITDVGFIELLCDDQWDNHLAFNVFKKLDQVSPAECRGWHSAKHGLYIAAGILAGNLDEMTRLFLSESRPHSCFQPNTKSRPELEQASHGQDKTDMHELSKLWNKQRQVSMCWRHPGLLAAELVGLPQDPAGLTATLNKDTFVCLSVCMFVCLY